MAQPCKLNGKTTVDLENVLSVAATDDGIRLTYLNGKQEVIAPLARRDRDRFFDRWLDYASPILSRPAPPRRAAKAG